MNWANHCVNAFYKAIENFENDHFWAEKINEAYLYNQWFTKNEVIFALNQWKYSLEDFNSESWLKQYDWNKAQNLKVGLILAGNIPLVGFHDILCSLCCGAFVKIKFSKDDEILTEYLLKKAEEFLPELSKRWIKAERLTDVDKVIATGGNNTSRYFEYYFRNVPLLLRKNRNSVALITGNETDEELKMLGEDVFRYFGLGCRNVTHIYLPSRFSIEKLFDTWASYAELINHNKYANNYHYHKALILMNLDKHLDTGYLIALNKKQIYSPIGTLNYSFYNDINEVFDWYQQNKNQIQCKVSIGDFNDFIKPGYSQKTRLEDYADGEDTVKWILTEGSRAQE